MLKYGAMQRKDGVKEKRTGRKNLWLGDGQYDFGVRVGLTELFGNRNGIKY